MRFRRAGCVRLVALEGQAPGRSGAVMLAADRGSDRARAAQVKK